MNFSDNKYKSLNKLRFKKKYIYNHDIQKQIFNVHIHVTYHIIEILIL